MAIRLITGRLKQRSRYFAKQQQFFYRKLHAVYITIDGCHYMWQRAQTATLHYTRGLADWPRLKPHTGMLTHLPLGDSGTRLQTLPAQDINVSKNITSHQLGLSRPTPLLNDTLTSNAHEWCRLLQMSAAHHFDSSSSTHLHCPRIWFQRYSFGRSSCVV